MAQACEPDWSREKLRELAVLPRSRFVCGSAPSQYIHGREAEENGLASLRLPKKLRFDTGSSVGESGTFHSSAREARCGLVVL